MYDLMVNSGEDLPLAVMLDAFKLIGRLVGNPIVITIMVLYLLSLSLIVLIAVLSGQNGLSKNLLALAEITRSWTLKSSRKHYTSRR